jgi:NAD(P)-dependent dehydrogenase (short-subunit alcohol dehydrogenase family)
VTRLNGKVALVTGARGGIGRAVAELFAAEGAFVYAADIETGDYEADRLQQRQLDVGELEEWERLVGEIVAARGTLDVLVNNAGVASRGSIHDVGLEEWDRVIRVNLTGTFFGMRAVLPTMLDHRAGSIINVSSTWGIVGTDHMAAYQASKGAVRTLTKNAAITYAPAGIRVNSMHPGLTDTPIIAAAPPEARQAVLDVTPLGRGAEPIEQAYGALFLASDESRFMTGAELVIDGGFTAR